MCGAKQNPKEKRRMRPNGSGTAYKRGKTWTAKVVLGWRIVELGGMKKRLPIPATKGGFLTKRDALAYCDTLLSGHAERAEKRLSHYYELYSKNKMLLLSSSTQQAYSIAWGKLNRLHNLPISKIGVRDIQDLLADVAPTYDTAKDARSLLSNLFQLAMYDGAMVVNPAQAVTLPQNNSREAIPFNTVEVTALWKHYGDGALFVGYILLMIYTGMMPAELFRLRKDMIDWDNKIIMGAGVKTPRRKTKPIVLADVILPVLLDLCNNASGETLIDMSEGTFYRTFYSTIKDAGCDDGHTPYSCRHTTGTALGVDTDTPPAVIAEVLRQKTITIQQRYIHAEAKDALSAVNKILNVDTL